MHSEIVEHKYYNIVNNLHAPQPVEIMPRNSRRDAPLRDQKPSSSSRRQSPTKEDLPTFNRKDKKAAKPVW